LETYLIVGQHVLQLLRLACKFGLQRRNPHITLSDSRICIMIERPHKKGDEMNQATQNKTH